MLKKVYLMDIRLRGNTISYAITYHANKAGKVQAVRGSWFISRFTVAGIRQYMQVKEQKQVEYRRTMQDIENAKQYLNDYEEWREKVKKAKIRFMKPLTAFRQTMVYLRMMKKSFYGSVSQEFNKLWKGKSHAVSEEKPEIIRQEKVDYSKLSLEVHAKLLSPPTADQMAELREY